MQNYIVKIIDADTPEASPVAVLHYLRRFDSEDLSKPIKIIDDALSQKPRKTRADKGAARKEAQ